MNIKDNDSLAAHLAAEVQADLLILMSDVDGIYTLPPSQDGARFLYSYCPSLDGNVVYGEKSGVGLGGMESKVSWNLLANLPLRYRRMGLYCSIFGVSISASILEYLICPKRNDFGECFVEIP